MSACSFALTPGGRASTTRIARSNVFQSFSRASLNFSPFLSVSHKPGYSTITNWSFSCIVNSCSFFLLGRMWKKRSVTDKSSFLLLSSALSSLVLLITSSGDEMGAPSFAPATVWSRRHRWLTACVERSPGMPVQPYAAPKRALIMVVLPAETGPHTAILIWSCAVLLPILAREQRQAMQSMRLR